MNTGGMHAFYRDWHARWHTLHDPAWRALAWLLQSPPLLDPANAQWQGQLAHLEEYVCADLPDLLYAWQQQQRQVPGLDKQTRLGRYAEKILGFYLQEQGYLHAAGLQVRVPQLDANGHSVIHTIGEFDFLLHQGQSLLHWELATKFYLFAAHSAVLHTSDYFLGPNLADSLGAKMQKIIARQLKLAAHAAHVDPALQVQAAHALVKGWLFYGFGEFAQAEGGAEALQSIAADAGLNPGHCHGWWARAADLQAVCAANACSRLLPLPRLAWMAPAALHAAQGEAVTGLLSIPAAETWLEHSFAGQNMPQLLACMREEDGQWREYGRVFAVPNDWQQRAESVLRHG